MKIEQGTRHLMGDLTSGNLTLRFIADRANRVVSVILVDYDRTVHRSVKMNLSSEELIIVQGFLERVRSFFKEGR